MRRAKGSLALAVALGLLACKGQEVTVFDMPMPGGSAGQAGSGAAGGGVAGALAAAGDMNGGGMAGSSGAAPGGSGGSSAGGGGAAGSAGSAGSAGMAAGTPCALDTDCSPGWNCEKPGCDAESGVCEPPPVFLPPEPLPVCGCDGITYWNDEIRRQNGVTLASIGECRATACSCDVGADCDGVSGASCSHLLASADQCGHGPGTCWVLPMQCMPTGDPMKWRQCQPPNSPDPPPPCVDTCMAIRSEKPHAPPPVGDDKCK